MSKTVAVTSAAHLSHILAASRVVVADFYADWCGPCRAIEPVYEALSQQLSRPGAITFTRIDTDAQREIARTFNISAMPTFLVFKAGRETKRIQGADRKALDAAVRQLAREASSADAAGAGDAGDGRSGGAGAWTGAAAPRGCDDITDEVDLQGLDFLNVDAHAGAPRAIFAASKPSALDAEGSGGGGGGGGSTTTTTTTTTSTSRPPDYIQSDTDEQLMLHIPFQSTLKLRSLHITSIPSPHSARPRTLHLYSNRSHVLGFDDADHTPPTQTVDLPDDGWDRATHTATVPLRVVKFQNIASLTVFVLDAQADADRTRIDRLRLYGDPGPKMAMGKLEKIGDEPPE